MTMREAFVKERNDALFSMDRKKPLYHPASANSAKTAMMPKSSRFMCVPFSS